MQPEALFDDPHLNATGGLGAVRMNDGSTSKVPLMPLTLNGQRPGIRLQPPLLDEHGATLLQELGLSDAAIRAMQQSRAAQQLR